MDEAMVERIKAIRSDLAGMRKTVKRESGENFEWAMLDEAVDSLDEIIFEWAEPTDIEPDPMTILKGRIEDGLV